MLMPVVTRLGGAVALAAAMAGANAAAQQAYRLSGAGGDPVLVDFLVVDRNGQPVLDLKPNEVLLKIDGRARPIVSLRLVDFSEASGTSLTESGESLPPPFGTNSTAAGRSVVILIDDDSIRPGRERDALAAVNELIASLPARARIVIATPQGGWLTKLTADRAEVRRVLSGITGHAFATDDVECRTRVTLRAVENVLAPFSADAAPTFLVLSGGLAGPRQDLPAGGNGLARATGRVQVKPCDLRIEDFLRITDVIASSRAHLSVIQLDDVAPTTNMEQAAAARVDLTAGLVNLAGVAGGKMLHLTPASGNPLIAAERESSAYYVAGFEPTTAEGMRSTHRLDVQVARARVTVIRRPRMTIENAGPRATRAEDAARPSAMLRDPRPRQELPLRTAGYASRNPDPAAPVRIVVFAEPLGSMSGFQSVAAGLFDSRGRLVSEWNSAAGLPPGPILAALFAPPDTYRLRVAALDAAGRAGIADYFVDATLPSAGPLKLSTLMLGTLSNGVLRPALEFTSEATATASLEIYGERGGKPVVATVEVAETVNGPAVLTLPVQLAQTREADCLIATATIPISGLTPGDYIVRVTVNLQDHPQGRVVRTLRKR